MTKNNISWRKILDNPYEIRVGNIVPYYINNQLFWFKIIKIDGEIVNTEIYYDKECTKLCIDTDYNINTIQKYLNEAIKHNKV